MQETIQISRREQWSQETTLRDFWDMHDSFLNFLLSQFLLKIVIKRMVFIPKKRRVSCLIRKSKRFSNTVKKRDR